MEVLEVVVLVGVQVEVEVLFGVLAGSGGTSRGTGWKWRVSDDCYLHLHQHVALC